VCSGAPTSLLLSPSLPQIGPACRLCTSCHHDGQEAATPNDRPGPACPGPDHHYGSIFSRLRWSLAWPRVARRSLRTPDHQSLLGSLFAAAALAAAPAGPFHSGGGGDGVSAMPRPSPRRRDIDSSLPVGAGAVAVAQGRRGAAESVARGRGGGGAGAGRWRRWRRGGRRGAKRCAAAPEAPQPLKRLSQNMQRAFLALFGDSANPAADRAGALVTGRSSRGHHDRRHRSRRRASTPPSRDSWPLSMNGLTYALPTDPAGFFVIGRRIFEIRDDSILP
jgi:hypothetical protein